MDKVELKPCPFCGGSAETEETVMDFVVRCKICRAKIVTDNRDKLMIAIYKWNRRIPSPKTIKGRVGK